MKYALCIVVGLMVASSIQSERDKQQATESIAALGISRRNLIQSQQKEEKAHTQFYEEGKQLSVLEALSQYEENEEEILALQVELNQREFLWGNQK